MGDNWQGRRKEIRGKKKERKEGGRGVGKEEGREREKERQKGRTLRESKADSERWEVQVAVAMFEIIEEGMKALPLRKVQVEAR